MELVLFVGALIAVALLFSSGAGVDPSRGDLVDTDGYMRYLRVAQLVDDGAWFDATFDRSNHPYGESQHWTRPLDIYLVALTTLLTPFAQSDAIYWASYLNAPLLLIGLALVVRRAVRLIPPSLEHLTLPLFLGLPMVIAYGAFGRVDHHALILVLFGITVLATLLTLQNATGGRVAFLGGSLAAGLWVSTEYLVPIALVAVTLALRGLIIAPDSTFESGYRTFGFSAVAALLALVAERGPGIGAVEYDRISVVHVVVLAVICGVFWVTNLIASRGGRPRFVFVGSCLAGAIGLLVLYPDLAGGPFVEVDPRVQSLWLQHVGELRPLWRERTWISRALVLTPTVLGLISAVWLGRRRLLSGHLRILVGWFVAYAVLSLVQVRWGVFAHLLALVLVLYGLRPIYSRTGWGRLQVFLRPVIVVTVMFGPYALAYGLDSSTATFSASRDCQLSDVLPALQPYPQTTVLAEQDVGPEVMYRTNHSVIATPYHRNDEGILYVHDTMGLPASDREMIESRLAERDVGLILICPNRNDITMPADPDGTFYQAVLATEPPGFVTEVPLQGATEYRLFAVNP